MLLKIEWTKYTRAMDASVYLTIRAMKLPIKTSKIKNDQKSIICQIFQNQFEKNCKNFFNFQTFEI